MSSLELAATAALFRVLGDADPALLPRIVSLFAKCGMVPAHCHAERRGDDMQVDIAFAALERSRAEHFAEVLRQLPIVSMVDLCRDAPARREPVKRRRSARG